LYLKPPVLVTDDEKGAIQAIGRLETRFAFDGGWFVNGLSSPRRFILFFFSD
jgi:hypothetical protein